MNNYAAQGAVSTYQANNVQTAIETASSHRLIDMMMERTLSRIAIAKGHMNRAQIAEKGNHIGGAMSIIDGLRASLDLEAGGDLARNLDNLYEYMSRRLLVANLENDESILDEVSGLVRELRSAWIAIGDQQNRE